MKFIMLSSWKVQLSAFFEKALFHIDLKICEGVVFKILRDYLEQY